MTPTDPAPGSSPRWRGRPKRRPFVPGRRRRLIPALAGTTPSSPGSACLARGSSPRWRGRPTRSSDQARKSGLIPALAGTTSATSRTRPSGRAHPRAGGDDPRLTQRLRRESGGDGSSPRWRGRPDRWPTACRGRFGLIPALAGTTRDRLAAPSEGRAHPRAGGDDVARRSINGNIPALAGTTEAWGWVSVSGGAHPRAGGDDGLIDGDRFINEGSSPRWRGRRTEITVPDSGAARGSSPRWRGRLGACHRRERVFGLIPALAGTTPRSTGPAWGRGGSSPRWRGRRSATTARRGAGLIPALAGTTQCNLLPYPTNLPNRAGSSPRWRGRRMCPKRKPHRR